MIKEHDILIEEFKNASIQEQDETIKELSILLSGYEQDVTYLANIDGRRYASEILESINQADILRAQLKELQAIRQSSSQKQAPSQPASN